MAHQGIKFPMDYQDTMLRRFVDIRGDIGYIFCVDNTHRVSPVQSFPHRLSCVIFDMDGTLTQTSELIFASFNHIARKYLAKTLTPAEIVSLFGPPEEGGLSNLVGEARAEAAMDELCEFYRDHHAAMASLHDGVEEVLRFLKDRGVKLALFTGKGDRTTGITLDALKIGHYFDIVVSGTDVVNHKPHHEGIEKVLEAFDLHPAEALMVGDSLADVKASRGAGVKMAAVVYDSYDRERLLGAGADLVFHSVREMFDWFRAHVHEFESSGP